MERRRGTTKRRECERFEGRGEGRRGETNHWQFRPRPLSVEKKKEKEVNKIVRGELGKNKKKRERRRKEESQRKN